MYNLPDQYQHRLEPAYFDDVLADSSDWQADVYRLAAKLARETHTGHLIDLGCGNGLKLKPYAADFKILGIDYGANLDAFAKNKVGQFLVCDFNQHPLPSSVFTDSVVICADVIEHIPQPDTLLKTLKNACETATFVLVSTPDRQRVYRGEHDGPPVNQYHCREWTNAELLHWFRSVNLPVRWHGWTVSNDNRRDQVWTSLMILSKTEVVLGLPDVFEAAPIVWDGLGIKHDS
jgi:SAM-dependent methyltransferase